MKKWDEEYKKTINEMFCGMDNYLELKLKLRRPMINQIAKYADRKKPIIECGAGTGKLSALFAKSGFNAFGIDIDDKMLQIARETSDKMSPTNPVSLMNASIKEIPFDDKYFSVAHSSGVIEHFSDPEIREILQEEMRVADTVVFAVPSPFFGEDEKMHGDERFLPKKKWRELINETGADIITDSGFHLLPFKKRLLRIVKSPEKIMNPAEMYLFTIKEKE